MCSRYTLSKDTNLYLKTDLAGMLSYHLYIHTCIEEVCVRCMHVCKHTYTKADIYTQTIANTQTQHVLGRNNVSIEVCHSVCICVCMSIYMHTNTIPTADTIESAPMTVATGPQYSVIGGFKPFVCAKPQIKWEIVARSNTLPAPPVLTICHNMS